MSVDGYISTPDDDLSWLEQVQLEGEDYGYSDMQNRCDTYIVGRKTYDVVCSLCGGTFPQSELFECYVITREERPPENGVLFYNGDVDDLIASLKEKEGKDIYCDGGGQVIQLLMKQHLIDEYIISVIPTFLGDGKRLFIGETPPQNLTLMGAEAYKSGLVQLKYKRFN